MNLQKLIKSLPVELNKLFNLRVEGLEQKYKSGDDSLCFKKKEHTNKVVFISQIIIHTQGTCSFIPWNIIMTSNLNW